MITQILQITDVSSRGRRSGRGDLARPGRALSAPLLWDYSTIISVRCDPA